MAGKMAPSMDECSRPVHLTSRIEETQNLTSQSCVFSLRHQKSDGDLHKNSSLSLTFLHVGRRGTNQLHLLERYLDVLVKHTTEIPPPTALVEGTALSALVEGVSLR
jgi:hypothetical protein